jgi:hypothetical protein
MTLHLFCHSEHREGSPANNEILQTRLAWLFQLALNSTCQLEAAML